MFQMINPNEMNGARAYGEIFSVLADQIMMIKQRAAELYKDAADQGIDPADFDADFSLIELDLAVEGNVTGLDGLPRAIYADPETFLIDEEDDGD